MSYLIALPNGKCYDPREWTEELILEAETNLGREVNRGDVIDVGMAISEHFGAGINAHIPGRWPPMGRAFNLRMLNPDKSTPNRTVKAYYAALKMELTWDRRRPPYPVIMIRPQHYEQAAAIQERMNEITRDYYKSPIRTHIVNPRYPSDATGSLLEAVNATCHFGLGTFKDLAPNAGYETGFLMDAALFWAWYEVARALLDGREVATRPQLNDFMHIRGGKIAPAFTI